MAIDGFILPKGTRWNSTFKQKPIKPLKRSPFKRSVASKTARTAKLKVWSTTTADKHFSIYIRTRDPICRICLITPTKDNSHFWGRGNSGTRYDPKNCIGICRPCHDEYEHLKNYEYKNWMEDWLGLEEYCALERRARSFKKRSEAVAECKVLLAELHKLPQ